MGVTSARSVARAREIVEANLLKGDSSLKRLHEEAKRANLPWISFEEVKLQMRLTTIRRPDGRLAWVKEQAREEAA